MTILSTTKESELALLASVMDAVNIGAIVLDQAQRIVLWNRWMMQHSGHTASAVMGVNLLSLYPDLQGRRIDTAVKQALSDGLPSVLSQTLHKSPFELYSNLTARGRAERMQQAVAIRPLSVAGAERHCLIEINDVSIAVGREKLLREQAQVLHLQSFSDGLTGIANRRHFDVMLDKELRRAKRASAAVSLLMIDIDHFKAFNDQHGHQYGDQCLIMVAQSLAAILQRPGDMIARYGGEEFSVILPETDQTQALLIAETMREKMAQTPVLNLSSGHSTRVTLSIGVATHTAITPVEMAALIGTADRALYMAKHAGRNRVVGRLTD